MTKANHTIDGVHYCGEMTVALPNITLTNVTAGDCPIIGPGPDPGPIPTGRQTQGWISWGISMQDRAFVDLTKWENSYGRAGSASRPPTLFPGPPTTGSGPAILLGSDKYIALQFVAAGHVGQTGYYIHGNNPYGPPIDISISEQIGDFVHGLAGQPMSVVLNQPADLGTPMKWTIGGTRQVAITAGKTYYLNIRFTNGASVPLGDHPVYMQHVRTA